MLRRTSILFLFSTVLVAVAVPGLAHADLLSTNPAEGTVAAAPVERIELVYSGEVEPTGGGFRLIDANGSQLEASVFQPTPSTVVIEPRVILPNGVYAVAWQVQSADSHLLSGSFSFAVEVPVAGSAGAGPERTDPATTGDATVTTVASPARVPSSAPPPPATVAQPRTRETVGRIVADEPATATADWLARVGRWAAMTGALLAIGAFAFAATSLIGTRSEVRRAVLWVRRGAVLVLAGTSFEVIGISAALAGSAIGAISVGVVVDVLGSQFGLAVLLRFAGAIAMLQDPRLVSVSPGPPVADASRLPDILGSGQAPSQVVTATVPSETTYRLEVQHEWAAGVGMVAVAASFMFDGHTVTAEPGVITRLSALVHVVFAGVWLGGVVVMANTLTRRWRGSVPLDAMAMAVRFSRVAAGSLVLLALAGLVLTWSIVDTPSDLVSGAWGRLLLVKVSLVTVAAALGAYNHFKVVPRLDRHPDETETSDLLRRVVRIEGAVLLVVVAVTAILVGAAT